MYFHRLWLAALALVAVLTVPATAQAPQSWASGDLGIGVGAGANVLLGGSTRTFALQPLSLQARLLPMSCSVCRH
jgi:hypothetical protein